MLGGVLEELTKTESNTWWICVQRPALESQKMLIGRTETEMIGDESMLKILKGYWEMEQITKTKLSF